MTYPEERAHLLARPDLVGSSRRRALTELTDGWVASLFDAAGGPGIGAAMVAVGSYGRAELSPGSDLDLLLLVPGTATTAQSAQVASAVWYPVWDAGLRLDHVRPVDPDVIHV